MIGTLAVLYVVNELPGRGISLQLGGIFAAGLVLLLLFVWRQFRISYPLIRMSFFRNPTFCLSIGILSAMIFGYFGGYLLTPIYLETGLGTSLALTSLIMTLRPVSNSIASPLWVRLPRHLARHGPVVGASFAVLAMCSFALGAWEHSIIGLIGGLILGGLALGVANPGLTVRLINTVSPEEYGSAAGLQVMFTQISSVLGLSVLGGVAAGKGTAGHAPYYVVAYLIGAGVAVIAVFLAVYLNRRVPDSTADLPSRLAPPGAEPDSPEAPGQPGRAAGPRVTGSGPRRPPRARSGSLSRCGCPATPAREPGRSTCSCPGLARS